MAAMPTRTCPTTPTTGTAHSRARAFGRSPSSNRRCCGPGTATRLRATWPPCSGGCQTRPSVSFPTATATATRRTLPPFTEEHEELRESIRRFVENELRPHAGEWEDAQWFPNEVFTRMAELGFLGLKYPEEYGGQGGDYLHDAVLTEELSRCGSGGLAAGIGAHISIATPPIWKFGTDDQKERYLRPAIAGEKIAALGISEPDSGSDVASIRTRAERGTRGWVGNGARTYIPTRRRGAAGRTPVTTSGEG